MRNLTLTARSLDLDSWCSDATQTYIYVRSFITFQISKDPKLGPLESQSRFEFFS